jgi:putative iron-regulated protein
LMGGLAMLVVLTGAAGAQCAGDCDGNGTVAISELVTGVNMALGRAGECAAMDTSDNGAIEVAELVAAVNRALSGCDEAPATPQAVVENYAKLLYANYSDTLAGAQALKTAVDAFVAAPSAASLQAAKEAWLASRPPYLQTEMARFYDGPIDNAVDGPEGLINSWPLDESYIDYVEGAPDAGIVNAVAMYPTIDADLLVSLNEGQGEETISTGYHAIEFLLWGQDFNADGPGNRPFTDYVTGGGGTAANQERRGQYLRAVTGLLVDDLQQVTDAWKPGVSGNYRAEFESVDPKEALRRLLTGVGTLSGGELTGERMSVAFDTKDQEDEHSCFSDNTTNDFRYDERALHNAFFGTYGSISGPSVYDLCHAENATLAEAARAAFDNANAKILLIPAPFDQAIIGDDSSPGRQAIGAAIAGLEAQTIKIAECADALGITISTTSP